MSSIYMHIGPVKTGSTYLQGVLWKNRDELRRQGVLYPYEREAEDWLAVTDVQDGAYSGGADPNAAGVWSRIVSRALHFDGRVVISHELFGLSERAHVERIIGSLAPVVPDVVVMARCLADLLPSAYQEKVKGGDPVGWPDYLAGHQRTGAPWSDAGAIARLWMDYVPAERIHIVTVPRRGASRSALLARFAEVVGFETSRLPTDDVPSNASLDELCVDVLRKLIVRSSAYVPNAPEWFEIRSRVEPALWSIADAGKVVRMPESAREWVEQESRRRQERIIGLGCPVYGDLEELLPTDEAFVDDAARGEIGDQELLDKALDMVMALLWRS